MANPKMYHAVMRGQQPREVEDARAISSMTIDTLDNGEVRLTLKNERVLLKINDLIDVLKCFAE
jgi:hypothetical protein